MIDPFFDRTPTKWNISDFTRFFLENAPDQQQPTYNKVTSAWTNSIRAIYHDPTQTKHRRDKAKFLCQQWDSSENKNLPQQKLARTAYQNFERTRPQSSTIIGLINNGHIGGDVSALCTEVSEVVPDSASGEGARKRKKSTMGDPVILNSSSDDSALQDKKKKKKKKGKKKEKKNRNPAIDNDPKPQFLENFTATYKRMGPSKKWELSTGTVVEDVIYEYALQLEKQTIMHLFILDPEDSVVADLFSKAEWLEIRAYIETRQRAMRDVGKPECLDWVPDNVTTTKQLRDFLFGEKMQQGTDEEWVFDVYRQFLFLLEHPDKPLTRNNCENWLEIFVIGPLVHRCLMSIEGIQFRCKESHSIATRRVNNKNRTDTGTGHYLLPSPRLDGIFALITPDFEFGACEVGKDDKGPEDTKRLDDFRKLVVTMAHMLLRLHRELAVAVGEEVVVVGFMCSGLTLQTLRMWSPNGGVCLLAREKVLRIPAGAVRLKDLKSLLRAVWLLKKTLGDSVALVLGCDPSSSQ